MPSGAIASEKWSAGAERACCEHAVRQHGGQGSVKYHQAGTGKMQLFKVVGVYVLLGITLGIHESIAFFFFFLVLSFLFCFLALRFRSFVCLYYHTSETL